MTEGAPIAQVEAAPPEVPGSATDDAERVEDRRQRARLMTYRLMPLWMFLFVFGLTLVWEVAARGNAITGEKLQAAALLALVLALFIGAPIGIRFFNPLPPKT